MATPTGVPVLDTMLHGGIPENRAILVVGGPGTGKTTLGMQFLQDGLERGETCLFVSTEQTPEELADSLAPYEFDLNDPRLSVETVHATQGSTIESDGQELILDSLGSRRNEHPDERAFESLLSTDGFSTPFTQEYLQELLEHYAPCDRVLFDSISGLEAMATDRQMFRRSVLDFIRLFTDQFGASTIFTAEEPNRDLGGEPSTSDLLQFNTHGVIRVWRERVKGDYHRFIQIQKMRGVDHETKAFELEFDPRGVHTVPERRTLSTSVMDHDPLKTGLSGLDELCGNGLIQGGTALLEHDGLANVNSIVVNMLIEAVRRDHSIVLLPPSNLEPERLNSMIAERIGSLEDLLESNQLFVLDLVGNWTRLDYNVFSITERDRILRSVFGGMEFLMSLRMKRIFKKMNQRRGDRQALVITYTDAMLQELTPKEIRRMHQWGKKKLFYPEDTVLFVQNPKIMDEKLSEFFILDSQQVLRTWMHDHGLQYIRLDKSPTGDLGSSKLVKHVNYPPYVRVQRQRKPVQTTTALSNGSNNSR